MEAEPEAVVSIEAASQQVNESCSKSKYMITE